MRLYKILQNGQYDTYDFIVVVAENEDDAKLTQPEGKGLIGEVYNRLWSMCNIKGFTVIDLGEAMSGVYPGCLAEGKGEFDTSVLSIFIKKCSVFKPNS